jgi:hypothetical protein
MRAAGSSSYWTLTLVVAVPVIPPLDASARIEYVPVGSLRLSEYLTLARPSAPVVADSATDPPKGLVMVTVTAAPATGVESMPTATLTVMLRLFLLPLTVAADVTPSDAATVAEAIAEPTAPLVVFCAVTLKALVPDAPLGTVTDIVTCALAPGANVGLDENDAVQPAGTLAASANGLAAQADPSVLVTVAVYLNTLPLAPN